MRIYLDNCCYNRPFDDQTQIKVLIETLAKLDIQRQMRDGILKKARTIALVRVANPVEFVGGI